MPIPFTRYRASDIAAGYESTNGKFDPLYVSAHEYDRAVEATVEACIAKIDPDVISNWIRTVDGKHDMGAGALGEALADLIVESLNTVKRS